MGELNKIVRENDEIVFDLRNKTEDAKEITVIFEKTLAPGTAVLVIRAPYSIPYKVYRQQIVGDYEIKRVEVSSRKDKPNDR